MQTVSSFGDHAPIKNTALRFAYKNYQVKQPIPTDYNSDHCNLNIVFLLMQNTIPLAKARLASGRYLSFVGSQRLPSNPRRVDPTVDAYGLWNAQISRVFSPRFEVYLGGENYQKCSKLIL